MIVISVIVGSTREGRFSEKPARWILQHLKKRDGVEARLLDLRDYPLPFFDQPATPAMPGRRPYEHQVVKKWTAEIARSDGFVFVRPEYNYGRVAGARGVQQLREIAIELQLAPVRSSVHIPVGVLWAHFQGGDVDAGLAELAGSAGTLMDDLLWWTTALKMARAGI